MTGLIIATHGDLAASALEAAELLVGEQEQVESQEPEAESCGRAEHPAAGTVF